MWNHRNSPTLLVGVGDRTAILEKVLTVSRKAKPTPVLGPPTPTLNKRNENVCPLTNLNTHRDLIHNSLKLETPHMSTRRRTDGQSVMECGPSLSPSINVVQVNPSSLTKSLTPPGTWELWAPWSQRGPGRLMQPRPGALTVRMVQGPTILCQWWEAQITGLALDSGTRRLTKVKGQNGGAVRLMPRSG